MILVYLKTVFIMITILSFGEGMSLCFSENKHWVINTENNTYDLSDKENILPLLPLLEVEYSNFIESIKKQDLSENMVNDLLIIPLVKYPFDNQRKFWAEDAIEWIIKSNLSDSLTQWAKTIPIDWMPQKLKHRFIKLFPRKLK